MLNHTLSPDELARWQREHRLVLPNACGDLGTARIQAMTEELSAWPDTPGKWMRYYEQAPETHARMLCRIENFVPYHEGFRELLQSPALLEILGQLMGEPAVLFKEKINFKLPGGAGFAPHQDAPAFASFGHRYHITMMIAIDDATVDNGCLEFAASPEVGELLDAEPDGTIAQSVVDELTWTPLETRAGDVVFFDSYIPHRSPANAGKRARRATYVTYNRRSEGDVRDSYFAKKRQAFPPECERVAGVDYSQATGGPFNLGNPIR